MMSLIELNKMSCRIGRKLILEEVSCAIGHGERIAIVGPNGAGKSTFLKVVMGMLPAEDGENVKMAGVPVNRLARKEIAKKVAYVPQVTTQLFPFTVRHFVEMARYAHQSPWEGISAEDREFCKNVLARTGMAEFAERTLDTLSGGELQRVWIAGAVAQGTEMLLLDEALSQMDYRFQQRAADLLAELNREEKKTVVQVTHDVNRAALESGRILALAGGRLIFDGPPREMMTEDVLHRVYGVRLRLIDVPGVELPMVIPGNSL